MCKTNEDLSNYKKVNKNINKVNHNQPRNNHTFSDV